MLLKEARRPSRVTETSCDDPNTIFTDTNPRNTLYDVSAVTSGKQNPKQQPFLSSTSGSIRSYDVRYSQAGFWIESMNLAAPNCDRNETMTNIFHDNTTTRISLVINLVVSGLLIGCGSGDKPPEAASSPNGSPAPVNNATADNSTSPAEPTDTVQSRRQNERWTDANGVEYLGEVPLDVFFDQPYSVASDRTPLTGVAANLPEPGAGGMSATGAVPPANKAPAEESTPAVAGADSGAADWQEIMPMETITSEINTVRNFLNQSLQSVGSYNRSMLMVAPNAASLAVLAGIVMEHPGDVNWKEDAIYIRDLAKQMNSETLQPGKKDQDRLLRLFENMASILDRSKPAGLKDPVATDTFADVAEMRLVMMRMAAAEKKMKTEAGSASSFESQKKMIIHEASMLGSMTHIVTLPGYGYSDDPEFIGYAQKIVDAAREIRNAADAGDFSTYELALTKISTACQECHSQYKNN